MAKIKLTGRRRAELRSQAQTLFPYVMVGHDGVSAGLINALNEALECHELVKVKFQDFKDDVQNLSFELEKKTDSTLIAVTGFTAVFYRKRKEKKQKE
ncbi:MAG: YhbY family RNA-binding protein [Spirochaetia bacterium]|nr:YhbY family RNA-binding protein [Spirochaetia bacterium]